MSIYGSVIKSSVWPVVVQTLKCAETITLYLFCPKPEHQIHRTLYILCLWAIHGLQLGTQWTLVSQGFVAQEGKYTIHMWKIDFQESMHFFNWHFTISWSLFFCWVIDVKSLKGKIKRKNFKFFFVYALLLARKKCH